MHTAEEATSPTVPADLKSAEPAWACIEGNEAAARIAYLLSEVIAIYPITPASAMGELSDAWSASGSPNLWGTVPEVVEMQSEAGAAGTVHGSLLAGALSTTFTSSQGLLLMLPNMFKIAGELTPAVIHVAARAIATHALSIFGDHSDVMAARTTGWAMLASGSVQEAQDMALVAHLATLESRVPFLHFFDGFRTSHEVNKIQLLDEADVRWMVDEDFIAAHRGRRLTPDRPVLRGSAQNPDVFFQAREAANRFYERVPGITQSAFDRLGDATGRHYSLVEYVGAPDAERVVVTMGSSTGALTETVEALTATGERVGVVSVRLFRPFPLAAFLDALPETVASIAVLDRTKEPGALGEPLYQDVVTALANGARNARVIGGRYGLASKEFTPAMAKAVFDELSGDMPKHPFTLGIVDDVTHLDIPSDDSFSTEHAHVRAQFFGLGSDGTVGASKSTVKIVGTGNLHSQGYFVYDSKKSGSVTVSHVRLSIKPIASTYLISSANFVACHQFSLLDQIDVLKGAEAGAMFLLNSPLAAADVWPHLPVRVRRTIQQKSLRFYVVDAHRLAKELGLGGRINTIMQACFFALSDVLPAGEAQAALRASVRESYGKRGPVVVERNLEAIERGPEMIEVVDVPTELVAAGIHNGKLPPAAPDFVKRVTAMMMSGDGDRLPVSALPIDGTFPTGTSRWEKRAIAQEIPIWDPEICIDCGHCVIVCPHAAVRMNVFEPGALDGAPDGFASKDFHSKEAEGLLLTIQVAPEDCTGCGVCVDVCPARSKTEVKHKALNMEPILEHVDRERANFDFFTSIPEPPVDLMDPGTVKGSQIRLPLFEFSGACAGCGETPYLKLLTQLFGDRILVANATGCSSIYGGNLPTTPWTVKADGRGPAWANSLFEDNAEFGLGMRLAVDTLSGRARALLEEHSSELGGLAVEILEAACATDREISRQRERIEELKTRLRELDGAPPPAAGALLELADLLAPKSVWIVGGDGWAYDIGSGGLDHVLSSGRDVNVLVLDTEVYSNTGGQASKATPRGAIAKFAARGKSTGKKDLGLIAAAYGDVYVAQVALGANYNQTIKALREAEAWPGPSLIIAYSTCIAHGIDMATSMSHQKDAVKSGYWPLYRFHPGAGEHERPLQLDSQKPTIPLENFVSKEGRFAMLSRSDPARAKQLLDLAQMDIEERRRLYEQMAGVERRMPEKPNEDGSRAAGSVRQGSSKMRGRMRSN